MSQRARSTSASRGRPEPTVQRSRDSALRQSHDSSTMGASPRSNARRSQSRPESRSRPDRRDRGGGFMTSLFSGAGLGGERRSQSQTQGQRRPSTPPGAGPDRGPRPSRRDQQSPASAAAQKVFGFFTGRSSSRDKRDNREASPTTHNTRASTSHIPEPSLQEQPRGQHSNSAQPSSSPRGDGSQLKDLQHRNHVLQAQLQELDDAKRKLQVEQRTASEWREKWNLQNFKLNLLVDMLVLRVLETEVDSMQHAIA